MVNTLSVAQHALRSAPTGTNVARYLSWMAQEHPEQTAVISGIGRDRAGKGYLSAAEFCRIACGQ